MSTITMRFIKILLILPFLVYGGIKAYIWYDVQKKMDDVIAMAAPFAEVSYGSVVSSLKGTVGIEDIVIRPMANNDVFTIQEISVTAPGILDILFMGNRVREKEFPEQLGLEFKKIGIDLNSKTFAMFSDIQAQAALQQPQRAPLLVERIDALGCGDVEKFGLNEFTAMGYNPLELDFEMNMKFQKVTQKMNLDIRIKDRDLYDVSLNMQFPLNLDKIKLGAAAASEQAISHMSLEYVDRGYHKLRNKYCAQLNGGSIGKYIETNISKLSAELGAVFPEKYTEAYRDYLTNGGKVSVIMNPAEPASLNGLEFYKTSDVLDILGIGFTINGVNIDNESIGWNDVPTKERGGNTPIVNQKVKPTIVDQAKVDSSIVKKVIVKPASPSPDPLLAKAKYRTVNKWELDQYIGKNIQVETSVGKRRQGQLESVSGNSIRILVRYGGGGEFSFPVNLNEILDAKVRL